MGLTDEIFRRGGQVLKAGPGIVDRASGTVKQVAGDILNRPGLRRQGTQEELKGEAKDDLAQREQAAEAERVRAEAVEEQATQRAAEAAKREFETAQRTVDAQEQRVEAMEAAAERKEREVEALETITDPDALAESSTRPELEDRARELGVTGRTNMSKRELAEAIVEHS